MTRMAKLLAVAALALASTAYASEGANPAAGNPARGEALYNAGLPDRNVPACMSCHGTAGKSGVSANPKLAAQHAAYTFKQLQDFKAKKDRNNAVMSPYAGELTEQNMRDLAAYLEKQPAAPGAAKSKDTILLGQKIYRGGIAEKSVPACAGCHSANGAGIPAQYPRLGGQWAEYTEAQLVAYRAGQRKNSVQMSAIAARMSDAEIKAVADYIAGVR